MDEALHSYYTVPTNMRPDAHILRSSFSRKAPSHSYADAFLLRTLTLLVLISSPAPLLAAEDFSVEAERKGDLVEVRARAIVEAPFSVVWGTLTDYERLPEFVPGLRKSRVISRRGSTAVVEQSGEARFLMFTFPIEVTVESTERPPFLEVRRVSGNLRHLEGRYEAEILEGTGRVRLRWNGMLAPESLLPPLIGEVLMRIAIEEQFGGMVREIERRESVRREAQRERDTRTVPSRESAAR